MADKQEEGKCRHIDQFDKRYTLQVFNLNLLQSFKPKIVFLAKNDDEISIENFQVILAFVMCFWRVT